MFCEVPEAVREKKLSEGDLADHKLKNIVLIHREGNANIRRHLELLPLETFSSVSVEHQQSSSPSSIWFGFAFASSIPILSVAKSFTSKLCSSNILSPTITALLGHITLVKIAVHGKSGGDIVN